MVEQIRAKIRARQFELSKHAVDQSILRRVSVQELREAIQMVKLSKTIQTINTVRVA